MDPSDNKYKSILRYSNLAFQMIGVILAGTFGGRWLDKKLHMKFPVFLITGVILSVFGAMYQVIREVQKKEDQ